MVRERSKADIIYFSGPETKEHEKKATKNEKPIISATCRNIRYISLYIHLYSHILQLQKQEIKKNKGKRKTHNVSKNTTCQIHTNYAQRKRKMTKTLKIDDIIAEKTVKI